MKLYQAKVGSVQYTTIATRPNVSFAVSRLSQFLTNPSPKHIRAVDRLICYLLTTATHALAYYGAEELALSSIKTVEFASDAAFADSPDRKSSTGVIV